MGAPQPTSICRKFLGRGRGWVCDLGGSLSGGASASIRLRTIPGVWGLMGMCSWWELEWGRLSQHTFAENFLGLVGAGASVNIRLRICLQRLLERGASANILLRKISWGCLKGCLSQHTFAENVSRAASGGCLSQHTFAFLWKQFPGAA